MRLPTPGDWHLRHKAIIVAAVPLVAGLVYVGIESWLLFGMANDDLQPRQVVTQSYRILSEIDQITDLTRQYHDTHNPSLKDQCAKVSAQLRLDVSNLRSADNRKGSIASLVSTVASDSQKAIDSSEQRMKLEDLGGDRVALRQLSFLGSEASKLSSNLRDRIGQTESMLDKVSVSASQLRDRTRFLIGLGLIGSVALAFLLDHLIRRSLVSRVSTLVENSKRLLQLAPLLPAEPGADEIAELQLSMHDTAARLMKSAVQLKASQSRVRLMMERMPAGLFVVKENGQIKFVNDAAEQLLDKTLPQVIGQPLSAFFKDPSGQALSLDNLRASPRMSGSFDVAGDSVVRRVELSLDVLEGEPVTYVAIAIDVSEKHRWTQLRDRFTSMMAHDIAAPLTLIADMLNRLALETTDNDGRNRALIDSARNQTERLFRMFDDLLRLSSTYVDEKPLEPVDVSLRELLRECVAAVETRAEDKDVFVVLSCAEMRVFVDADRITRAVMNLLTNALKYSPSGGEIAVTASESGEFFEVVVSDEGTGIPAGQESAIFEPYRQVAGSAPGTGLGLAICAKIVNMHGGTISVSNKPEGGASFKIRCPKGGVLIRDEGASAVSAE